MNPIAKGAVAPPSLEVRQLRVGVQTGQGSAEVVSDVSFSVGRGETFAIVGESGCGKSLTALSVMQLLPEAAQITGGAVRIGGLELTGMAPSGLRDVRGRRVAMIFQEPATSLNPVLTVRQQIAEVLARHSAPGRDWVRARALELLRLVNIPDPERRLDEYPFQLSGGMKQRVMIAMALALEPEVLIADEPTTALDVTIQAQVLALLKDLQAERGTAIVLITHDLGVVSQLADTVAVMYAGQIVEMGPAVAFFDAPRHPYAQKLFAALPTRRARGAALAVIPGQVPGLHERIPGCRFADRCEFVQPGCRTGDVPLRALGPGCAVRCIRAEDPALQRAAHAVTRGFRSGAEAQILETGAGGASPVPDRPPPGASPALFEIDQLKVHFPVRRGLLQRTVGQVRAVDGVSLRMAPGQTLALVGESGCGKSTLGKAAVGLLSPTAGSVRLEGRSLAGLQGRAGRAYRQAVQMVFQDPFASLDPRMQVLEILKEGLRALEIGTGEPDRNRRAAAILEQVGLPSSALRRYPHEFSGGQRQRIAIARALAVSPRVLICDEPTSALDVSVQAQILNLLRQLQQEIGVSLLFITHNISVVEFLAQRVAVMYLGRIVEEGPVGAVIGSPRHPYTRALLAAAPVPGRRVAPEPLSGEMPSAVNPPAGCHFHPRCPHATAVCRSRYPDWVTDHQGHSAACILAAPEGAGTRGPAG